MARFQTYRVPVAWLLHRGRFYVYKGGYEIEDMHQFAIEEYEKASVKGQIPVAPGAWEKLWSMMKEEIEENGGVLNTLMMKDEDGKVNVMLVVMVYAIPLTTLSCVCFILLRRKEEDSEEDDQKKI